jgi:hypothetical protein
MADKKISQLDNATTPLAGTETLPIVQGGATKKVTVDNLTAGKAVAASSLTTTGSVGIGIASPAQKLHVASAGANYIVSHNTSGSTSALLMGAESGKTIFYSWTTPSGATGVPITFVVGAAENMRLDSAGLLTLQTGDLKFATAGKGIDFSANSNAAGMTSELLADYEEGTFTPVVAGSSTAGTATHSTQEGTYTKVGRLVTFRIYVVWTGGTGTGSMDVTGLPFASNAIGAITISYFDQISLTASNYLTGAITFASGTNIRLYQSPVAGGYAAPVSYSAQGGLVISGQYFV